MEHKLILWRIQAEFIESYLKKETRSALKVNWLHEIIPVKKVLNVALPKLW